MLKRILLLVLAVPALPLSAGGPAASAAVKLALDLEDAAEDPQLLPQDRVFLLRSLASSRLPALKASRDWAESHLRSRPGEEQAPNASLPGEESPPADSNVEAGSGSLDEDLRPVLPERCTPSESPRFDDIQCPGAGHLVRLEELVRFLHGVRKTWPRQRWQAECSSALGQAETLLVVQRSLLLRVELTAEVAEFDPDRAIESLRRVARDLEAFWPALALAFSLQDAGDIVVDDTISVVALTAFLEHRFAVAGPSFKSLLQTRIDDVAALIDQIPQPHTRLALQVLVFSVVSQ